MLDLKPIINAYKLKVSLGIEEHFDYIDDYEILIVKNKISIYDKGGQGICVYDRSIFQWYKEFKSWKTQHGK